MKTIYVDTSVFGGNFDEEFELWTKKFFKEALDRSIILLKSEVVDDELSGAPIFVQKLVLEKADLLVSWNFKHIVNIEKIHGYNAVNLKKGLQTLEIRNPREAFDYDN